MANYLTYVKEDGKVTFNRAYRETFLFQMINHFEDNYVPDSAEGVEGYTSTRQTIAQKRRLRNQIYREANNYVKKYNETHSDKISTYDTDVLVDAFFRTSYGQAYASKRSDWEPGASVREQYVSTVREWTNGQNMNEADVRRVTISPYDPMFSDCDLFNDNVDEVGYIIGAMNSDGSVHLSKNGRPQIDMLRSDGNISNIYVCKNHRVGSYDDRLSIVDTELKPLEGRLSSVGYYDISHFIKSKKEMTNVKNYLLSLHKDSTPSDNKAPVSDDARKFMVDVCNYLTDNGIDFAVEMSADNHLVAKLEGSRTHIRLLDVESPQYQGRIYDDGRVAYVSSPKIKSITDSNALHIITNEDRLRMIKWYFGTEPVDIVSESAFVRTGRYKVGETGTIPGLDDTNRGGNKKYVAITKRAQHGTQSDDNSVLLAVKEYVNEKGVKVPVMLNIQLAASSYSRQKDSPETVFAQSIAYKNDDFINRADEIASRIPEGKELPGDIVTNGDGTRSWTSEAAAVANLEYYRHVIVREKLIEWVESA